MATITTATMIRDAIADALDPDVLIDTDNIDVVCAGSDVWLSGTVDSFAAFRRANLAAQGVPGVGVVHNDIAIVTSALDRP
jgi:osmotically-inducible protein OsmY